MTRLLLVLLLVVATAHTARAQKLFGEFDEVALAALAERVRHNETGGDDSRLLWWNEGESFPSLGIGHFIWYPAGSDEPFRESFPDLLGFLVARGATLPHWLSPDADCPWPDRSAWREAQAAADARLEDLGALLRSTIAGQAAFLLYRFERDVATLFHDLPDTVERRLARRLERVAAAPGGAYALIDYVNFKGSGVAPTERYDGQGWGLLQVLAAMSDDPGTSATDAFADAAALVLRQRVANSPAARGESRWLPGWMRRVDSYRSH